MSTWRYKPIFRSMSIWESIAHFIWHLKWIRVEVTYEILRKGDEGFDEAPFESSVVFVGEQLIIKSTKIDG